LIATGAMAFLLLVHPFLAVTARVDADVLVVEGWVPRYVLAAAVQEFQSGNYAWLVTSGMQVEPTNPGASEDAYANRAAAVLAELGADPKTLLACPSPYRDWLRTSASARAVHDGLAAKKFQPRGINVMTAGPHARETWTAYRTAFHGETAIGIISIPKTNYPAARWWLTGDGWRWVPKDFLGWLKEAALGLRG
jgi:hypothetical protein